MSRTRLLSSNVVPVKNRTGPPGSMPSRVATSSSASRASTVSWTRCMRTPVSRRTLVIGAVRSSVLRTCRPSSLAHVVHRVTDRLAGIAAQPPEHHDPRAVTELLLELRGDGHHGAFEHLGDLARLLGDDRVKGAEQFQWPAGDRVLVDEGAPAAVPRDQPLVLDALECLPHRDQADAILGREVALGRQAQVLRRAGRDVGADALRYLVPHGQLDVQHCASRDLVLFPGPPAALHLRARIRLTAS